MLLAIARRIDAPVVAENGEHRRAVSEMTAAEVDYCRQCFAAFTELVFAYTGGALRVEATELLLEEPARRLSTIGRGRQWLSAVDAFAGREAFVPRDELDSIAVLYKLPDGVVPALHGGAVGRDRGLRGSAYWTLWITDWDEPIGPFHRAAVAGLHEWLHNVSFYAHRVMGETSIPDCHAGEEYGYWDTDGGYAQWQAWNRDLMLRHIPREFWYRLTSRGPLLPSERLGLLFRLARRWRSLAVRTPQPRPGMHRWRDVGADWMRLLPQLEERDLRSITRLEDLRLTLHQPAANSHVVWALQTSSPVESPYVSGDPLQASPALDNVMAWGRLPGPGRIDDPLAGYRDAPLESLAWLRSPRADRGQRDLLLLRVDVAPRLLERLRVTGRPAADSVVGYVTRRDPAEGQRLNLIAATVDFGETPPGDELTACGA